ncbi:MAG TPA: hypothetical protein DEH78_01635 [Solibacterales bacterium]|nr:hypothetical protein [Bryobacterales bacterium]
MAITLDELRPPDPDEERGGAQGTITAIVKVKKAGYVPNGVTVRARIDDEMFTASLPASLVAQVRADPLVASLDESERLERID